MKPSINFAILSIACLLFITACKKNSQAPYYFNATVNGKSINLGQVTYTGNDADEVKIEAINTTLHCRLYFQVGILNEKLSAGIYNGTNRDFCEVISIYQDSANNLSGSCQDARVTITAVDKTHIEGKIDGGYYNTGNGINTISGSFNVAKSN